MISSGRQIQGKYYGGEHPITEPVILTVGENEIRVESDTFTHTFSVADISVSPRVAQADRFITFSDGKQCQCPDHPMLDNLQQEVKSEGVIAWLEAHLPFAIVSIAIVVCCTILGYMFGLQVMAEIVVDRIPISTEASLGSRALSLLDQSEWFKSSKTYVLQRERISDKFRTLYKDLAVAPYIKLEFRHSEVFGPNAFALPGGIIIVTDQMVDLARTDEEIIAVLAHELGHVEQRHSMRSILQGSFSALIATAVTADAASLSASVIGVPSFLVQRKYSRNFEKMADTYAFNLLKHSGISPESFADLMERLDRLHGRSKQVSFLSSHPLTAERIKHAREVADDEL